MSSTRITVASLSARMDKQDETLTQVVGLMGKIIERLDGQHNTPAPVVEITTAKSAKAKGARKSGKAKVEPQVSTTAPAKREMPAEVREGFAMVKATKDAISPLNKALAQVRKGQPWRKAHECTTEEVNAALAMVEALHGRKVAQAALKAYEVRVAHAAKRS